MTTEYRELANAISALSMDGVQKANSGHPGAPLGMAHMAEALWRGFLHHNPKNPKWANRDRFVLIKWSCFYAYVFFTAPNWL